MADKLDPKKFDPGFWILDPGRWILDEPESRNIYPVSSIEHPVSDFIVTPRRLQK
jgi:hypothetical protein